jgi:hypothetical protein
MKRRDKFDQIAGRTHAARIGREREKKTRLFPSLSLSLSLSCPVQGLLLKGEDSEAL